MEKSLRFACKKQSISNELNDINEPILLVYVDILHRIISRAISISKEIEIAKNSLS